MNRNKSLFHAICQSVTWFIFVCICIVICYVFEELLTLTIINLLAYIYFL